MLYGFLPNLGPTELIVLLVLGILLFGRKLPEIGRSVGKSIVEFKKGINGMEDEIRSDSPSRAAIEPDPVKPPQRMNQNVPRFDDAPSNIPPKV